MVIPCLCAVGCLAAWDCCYSLVPKEKNLPKEMEIAGNNCTLKHNQNWLI